MLGLPEIALEALLLHHRLHPSALRDEMLLALQRQPPRNPPVRAALLLFAPNLPQPSPAPPPSFTPSPAPAPLITPPPAPTLPPAPSLATVSTEDAEKALESALTLLPFAYREEGTVFVLTAANFGHDPAEAAAVLRRDISVKVSSNAVISLLNAASLLIDDEVGPQSALSLAHQRLQARAGLSARGRVRSQEAAASSSEAHSSPSSSRLCSGDLSLRYATPAPRPPPSTPASSCLPPPSNPPSLTTPAFVPASQPPPASTSSFLPALPPSLPPLSFSYPSPVPANPSYLQSYLLTPPPAQATSRSSHTPHSFVSTPHSTHTALSSDATVKDRHLAAISTLSPPPWYGPPPGALNPPDSSLPIPWRELVDSEQNAVSGVLPSEPPTAASLQGRVESYTSQRGLLISDTGRIYLRYILQGEVAAATTALSVLLLAVRGSHKLPRQGQSLSSAEKRRGHLGLGAILALLDRCLLVVEDSSVSRRIWASRAWEDKSLSARDLLNKLMDEAVACGKTDREVLDRWSATVCDTFMEYHRPQCLSSLYDNFARPIDNFDSPASLLTALSQFSMGSVSLSSLLDGSGLQQPPPRGRGSRLSADTAAVLPPPPAEVPSAAQFANELMLSFSRMNTGSAASSTEAEIFAMQSTGRLISGFADLPKLRESGRLPLTTSSTPIPTFDPGAPDGRFGLNCPFCGIGAPACKTAPEKAYKNIRAFETEHGCRPFGKDTPRPLRPTERIAHFSPRCAELWFAIRRHVAANPSDKWMEQPIPDATFYSSIPEKFRMDRPPPRR